MIQWLLAYLCVGLFGFGFVFFSFIGVFLVHWFLGYYTFLSFLSPWDTNNPRSSIEPLSLISPYLSLQISLELFLIISCISQKTGSEACCCIRSRLCIIGEEADPSLGGRRKVSGALREKKGYRWYQGANWFLKLKNDKAVTKKKTSELKCPKKLCVYSARTEYFMSYE